MARRRCQAPLNPRRSSRFLQFDWFFNPNFYRNALLFGLFVLILVSLTVAYCWHYNLLAGTKEEAARLYIDIFQATFIVLGFYILAYGIYIFHRNLIINTVDQNAVSLDNLMRSHFPFSARLYSQIYPDNPVLCKLANSPSTLAAMAADEPKTRWTEIILIQILYSSVSEWIDFRPVPLPDTLRVARSWFKSKLVREQWPLYRQFYSDAVVSFVEQYCFPCSEHKMPPWWAYFLDNTLVVALTILTAFSLLGSIAFWWTHCFEPLGTMVGIWAKALEALYISSALILIFYDNMTTTLVDRHEIIELADFGLKTRALDEYPISVTYYKQLYQVDCELNAIKPLVPASHEEELLFEVTLSPFLFENIDATLQLLDPSKPPDDQLRNWRSWGKSKIFNRFWQLDRQFYLCSTVRYVDCQVLSSPRSLSH